MVAGAFTSAAKAVPVRAATPPPVEARAARAASAANFSIWTFMIILPGLVIVWCGSAAAGAALAVPRRIELDRIEPLQRRPSGGEDCGHRGRESVAVLGPHPGFHSIAHFITPLVQRLALPPVDRSGIRGAGAAAPTKRWT